MGYDLRLEINIDIIKRDISPEQVRQAVRNVLDKLHFQYVEVQSVLIISPKD